MMEFGLLGELTAHVAGQPVVLGPARQRLVLAALVADVNRVVPVDQVVARVWGDDPPRRARAVLGSYVSRLRQALGSATVVWRSGGYLLAAGRSAVDVHRFHDLCGQARRTTDDDEIAALLTEALRLWRGPALTGLDGEWAAAERDRLHQRRLQAEHDLTDARLRAGRGADLVAELSSRTTEHPLDERVAGQYMVALYQAGRAADALEHYRDIRARLADELGTDPGSGLRELHQRVLDADPELGGPSPAGPEQAVSTGTSAMHSMRGDVAGFTGRDAEAERLYSALDAGDVRAVAVHAVDGLAGVGKTTFGVHVAHQIADRFPDGQLFVELHGHNPKQRPVSSADALSSLLLSTGLPPTAIPHQLDDRARLWRHRIAGRKILLLLDDALDEDQVRPLFPATSGSLVLITSRRRLAGLDAVVPLTLDVLPVDDAVRMLLRLAQVGPERHDAPAAVEVVGLCGRLPLAIALAAGRLRSHPTWTLRYLADQLTEAHGRLDHLEAGDRSVAVAFGLSFANLPADQQRLFRLLGVHPGPEIDAHAAAALQDSSLARARRCLEGLHTDHVVAEASPGRYRLHDLMQVYAKARAAELTVDDRDQALARVLRYYRDTAVSANGRLTDAATDARTWLGVELPVLTACVIAAADGAHWRLAVRLAAALHEFCRAAGHWDSAVDIHRAAVAAATRGGDQHGRAVALHNLGVMQQLRDEYDAAARTQRDAHRIFRELGDRGGQAVTLRQLGSVQYQLGRYDEASHSLVGAHDLYRDLGDRLGRAATVHNLGGVQYQRGQYTEASRTLTNAHDMYVELGNRPGQATTLHNLSTLHRLRGEYDEALRAATRSYGLHDELGSRLGRAVTLNELGVIRRMRGEYGEALQLLTRAHDLCAELGSRLGQAINLKEIGAVQRMLGEYEAATDTLHRARRQLKELGARDDESETLNNLGDLSLDHRAAGDPLSYYRQALDVARSAGLALQEAHALAGQGRCMLATRDPAAVEVLHQALAIYQRLGLPEAATITKTLAGMTT